MQYFTLNWKTPENPRKEGKNPIILENSLLNWGFTAFELLSYVVSLVPSVSLQADTKFKNLNQLMRSLYFSGLKQSEQNETHLDKGPGKLDQNVVYFFVFYSGCHLCLFKNVMECKSGHTTSSQD